MSIEVVSATVTPAPVPTAKSETVTEQKQSAPSEQLSETSEESETSDQELEANEENETSDSAEDDELTDELKDSQKPKKKNGFKKRIDKLTSAKAKAEQELEYWKNIAMSGGKKTAENEQEVKAETRSQSADTSSKPKADNFESHEEYVEALTDWKLEERERQKEMKAKESEVIAEIDKQVKDFQSKVTDFKKLKSDFDEVISDVDDIPFSNAIQDAILTSDVGPELMYELAKDRARYEKISAMSPIAAARAIGNIEAKILSSSSENKPKQQTITKAPPPISPVGGKTSAPPKSLADMDYEEYKRARMEQNKKR